MGSVAPLSLVEAQSVLLIEDDLSLVQWIDAVLNHLKPGLCWEYVTSGEAALERIQCRGFECGGSPYSLVISDIFLADDTTGFDVWLDCQQLYPEMPFVITSGLSTERYFSILQGVGNCPVFLPKPLTMGQCRTVLQEFL
jgi:hypothetical protein